MKTKAEIVQKLLDEKKINAEDAVVLLTSSDDKQIIYVDTSEPSTGIPWWQPPFNVC